MDNDRIIKAKGQFNFRLKSALKPLEMYGQKPFVDRAFDIIKMLNEIAICEASGERPPDEIISRLKTWQSTGKEI
jgi:hypothetical protein